VNADRDLLTWLEAQPILIRSIAILFCYGGRTACRQPAQQQVKNTVIFKTIEAKLPVLEIK
jgi:dienelactone hydrolase